MTRTFNGTTDRITVGSGALNGQTFFGSMFALTRQSGAGGAASQGVIVGGGTSDRLGIVLAASIFTLQARIGNGLASAPTITVPSSDGWVLVGWTKPTGTATVRCHRYKFSTNAWTHENAAGTNADAAANANAGLSIGSIGGASFLAGDVAAAATWRGTAFTDAQVESLAGSLMAWWQVAPTTFWILDQAAVAMLVPDLTGGGGGQTAITGTTVGADSCPLGYGMDQAAA